MSDQTIPAPMMIRVAGNAKAGFYLELGTSVWLKDDERPSLGDPVVVADGAGMCSLHEVTGITRPHGRRTMRVGPQIEWPQGGKELRDLERYR